MPRKPKTGDNAAQTAQDKPRRTAAQRRAADERYSAKNRENQRENFGNIGATFRKSEKFAIKSIYNAAGIIPAQAMRAIAEYLTTGGDTAAEKIKSAAAAYAERLHHLQNAQNATTTDTTSTTPEDPTTEEQE